MIELADWEEDCMNDGQNDKKSGQEESQVSGERLSRFLAHAGVASRRAAEELISAGRVRVNGVAITTQGVRIDPQQDEVKVDGRVIQAVSKHVYVLLNKPVGYVCTAHDPQGRPTVLDLLPDEIRRLRVYPVGRLDIDTSGLLLLTNDGDFALRMAHPRYSTEKRYEALIRGWPTEDIMEALRQGVDILEDDGQLYHTSPALASIVRRDGRDDCWIGLAIHEGHKRQVRRMLEAVGCPARSLRRINIGPLTLQDLPVGQWRYLTSAELQSLT